MKKNINFNKLFFLTLFLSNSFVVTNLFAMEHEKKSKNTYVSQTKKQKEIENPTPFPNEILVKILGYLEHQNHSSFARTCKYFNAILNSERIRNSTSNNISVKDIAKYKNVFWIKNFIKYIEAKTKKVDEKTRKHVIAYLGSACSYGWSKCVKFLLQNQKFSKLLNKNNVNIALNSACKFGHSKVVKVLLQNKKVLKLLSKKGDFNANFILCFACKFDNSKIVEVLLQNKKVLNLLRKKGHFNVNQALYFACLDNYSEVVKVLLQNQRVLELLTKKNYENVASWAKEGNHSDIIEILKNFLAQK